MPHKQQHIVDRLQEKIKNKRNPCIVGLDPVITLMPTYIVKNPSGYKNPLKAVSDTIKTFNKLIIDCIADIVPCVKPQMAFYEQYGSYGLEAFEETVQYAKRNDLIVIEDAKRGDISTTATAYANGHLGEVDIYSNISLPSLDVDLVTVNPYLGSDSILPFAQVCEKYGKGIFVLVKTSNPSSYELQNRVVDSNISIYEIVANFVNKIGKKYIGKKGYSAIGAVVGATYPEEARKLRSLMPNTIFLVPGYGSQGGKAEDVVPCFNKDGYGAIVSASRSILYAYRDTQYKNRFKPSEFYLAAREAAINMRDSVVNTLQKNGVLAGW